MIQSRRPAGGPDGCQSQSVRRLTLLMAYSTIADRAAASEQLIVNAILPDLRGVKPNRSRNGWSFFCPLDHRKKNAPAAIWVNDDGWISVHCFDCRRNDELRETLVTPHLRNRPSPPPPPVASYQPAHPPRRQQRNDLPARIWAETEAIPHSADHPARRWLANRNLWRARGGSARSTPLAAGIVHPSRATHRSGVAGGAAGQAPPPGPRPGRVCRPRRPLRSSPWSWEGNPALDRPQQDGGLDKRTSGKQDGRGPAPGQSSIVQHRGAGEGR